VRAEGASTAAAAPGADATPVEGGAAAAQQRRSHWRRNLQITGALMVVWFVVSFVMTYFARELNFRFFGWPFSYWVGAQGAILVYLSIVALYAHLLHRADRAHGVAEED